jgi:flagellar basal-body rod protein FlgF
MNYGLYLSASGVLTNLYRQDVYANNLANVKTVGFKHDLAMVRQRDSEAIEEQFGPMLRNDLLDKLGGGVWAGPQRVAFGASSLEQTGSPMDLALQSEKTFFNIGITDPKSGQTQVRLTRDGRFARDDDGYMITITGGHRVLDEEDKPIQLPTDAKIHVTATGQIFAGDDEITRLGVSTVTDMDGLIKQGQNLYAWQGDKDPRKSIEDARIRQGYVETSSVDPIKALMQLISATKAVTGNGNLIRYHDSLMDKAVNTLGRVA